MLLQRGKARRSAVGIGLLTSLLLALSAQADILDELDVVPVGDKAEVHINFTTAVRYIRHFPEGHGDTLRIFFEVSDPCVAETIASQEFKHSPPTDVITPFRVTFPEIVNLPGTGTRTCATTRTARIDNTYSMLIKFDKGSDFKIRLGEDNRSIVVAIPMLKAPSEVRVVPGAHKAAMPPENAAPVDLLTAARVAMKAEDYESATIIFNRILNLPPNDYSQEAQEMVGLAREKDGELVKAKAEYELYLKLYPNSEGAARIKQRLTALGAVRDVLAVGKPKTVEGREIRQSSIFGSLSQYYYGSNTNSTITDETTGNKSKTHTLDQSALITSFDVTGRYRYNQFDNKIVFRDAQTHNFPSGHRFTDINNVSAAYIDHENRDIGYLVRLGRQPGSSQGIFGRFDGVFARYGLTPQWRVTAVAGMPDDGSHNHVLTDRHFYGAAIEFGPIKESWSGNVYAIQEVADNVVDRRAIGTEMRYFSSSTSWFGLLDYDTIYSQVNIAMLQGNWTTASGYNFNVLLDHRKSPPLQAMTALQASGAIQAITGTFVQSVNDLTKAGLSHGDIYAFVRGLTPDTDLALIGVTRQITPRWQLGGDIHVNRTSSTRGVPASLMNDKIASQPSSGNIYTYSMQAIGSDTIFDKDTSVISGSYISDPHYDGENLSYSNLAVFRERWRVDTTIQLYHDKHDGSALGQGIRTFKVTPTLRVGYRWKDNMTLETEIGVEATHQDAQVQNIKTDTLRKFMFVGYRWDFM